MSGSFDNVLITGGAGFIGNRLVRDLEAQGVHVGVLDNLFVGMPMPRASEFVSAFNADIRDAAAVEDVFARFRPQVIVHLAAIHHIPTCERQPHLAMDVNILGTQTLLDACEQHGVRDFVLASSAAVYDWWETALIEDETPLRATDVYSVGKLANEGQLRVWASRGSERRGAIARIFNVIGHDDPNGHLIPDILGQLDLAGDVPQNTVVRLGNLAPRRDYTHGDDTAAGLQAMLANLAACETVQAFNLSRGQEHSVVDLVDGIGRHFGVQLSIESDPERVRRVDRPHLLGDSAKSRAVLGWGAEISIDEALSKILTFNSDKVHA